MRNKIILSLLLVCALAMPFFAKAITADELKAQIAALQSQITQLLAQLAQIQGGTTAWCHTFNANLGVGSNGAEVNALHSVLSKEVITGDFGWASDNFDENTASYVVGLQEKYASEILKPYNLKHGTGYVGKSTRAKLNKLYGCNNGNGEKVCPAISAPFCPAPGELINNGFDINGCPKPPTCSQKACTTDAKQCPDGSYVTRKGPNCEFAQCPTENNLPPVIDGITAPTQLKINEYGTWQIKAHDPENGSLTYSVDWGDSSIGGGGGVSAPTILKEGVQTSTFSHSYSKAGTYTINFTISDNNYKSVKTSTTVKVVETQTKSISVISPNGGEQWTFGTFQTINWKSNGIDKVVIYLWFPDGGTCRITETPAINGRYTFILQENYQCPNILSKVTAGSYKIQIWDADQKMDTGATHDSSDNFFTIVALKPDLIVKDFTYRNIPASTTDPNAYFDITIQNIGQVPALLSSDANNNFAVRVYKNSLEKSNILSGYIQVAPKYLYPNESYSYSDMAISVNIPGSIVIKLDDIKSVIVNVDDTNFIKESNEDNNTMTKEIK